MKFLSTILTFFLVILVRAERECGVRPHMRMRRIVGGKDSTFGAWPWQVLIRELTPNCSVTQYKYGGVLISDSYVLTVAHWRPEPNGVLVAVFGEYDLSKDLEPKKSVTIKVKEIIYHPEFNNRTFDNDLALLKLERPIQYDTHIVPICLPVHGADFTDRIATVSGWGRLRYGGRFPTVLQEVDVPIIENSKCQEMIHKLGYTKMILPSTLCAGYDEGEKDSCEGDSGGPLVVQRPDKRWELAGTVSSGIKCAARFLPGIYMRTSYHRFWIESIIGVANDEKNYMSTGRRI
ncbi:serine protease filzig-like isoform X2 [Sitodiplosis mosellana]|uniref:serine protease filzig-like isoform X2 n=1 Tax=Sitodiplosis mosellana TaxID=263140 RepID=UPI00244382D9|nr:serine protease filzig-like isoform X2 [Sitodiplosis mosellana]